MKTKAQEDEYVWGQYTREYSAQVEEMQATAGENGSDFLVTSFKETPNGVVFLDKLHGNWKQLYAAAFKLKPKSVFECGCGGMYHLLNMKKMLPTASVGGCDLLASQVEFGAKKFSVPKEILDNVSIRDFASEGATDGLGKYDFVYSHAVIMHISYDKAIQFLKNMGKIAEKNIMLVEGTAKHEYPAMFAEAGLLDAFNFSKPEEFQENAFLLTRR
jgi:2-polyprenyl-3-methyl-5-hydroxy-6-metoxy-1,4-benzoquinol methylase